MKESYDDYSRIIKAAAVGECYNITMNQLSKKPKKELDISSIKANELKSAKLQDPFMYYFPVLEVQHCSWTRSICPISRALNPRI